MNAIGKQSSNFCHVVGAWHIEMREIVCRKKCMFLTSFVFTGKFNVNARFVRSDLRTHRVTVA